MARSRLPKASDPELRFATDDGRVHLAAPFDTRSSHQMTLCHMGQRPYAHLSERVSRDFQPTAAPVTCLACLARDG